VSKRRSLAAMRAARRDYVDELDQLKAKRFRFPAQSSMVEALSTALKRFYGDDAYIQTYAQETIVNEMDAYYARRERVFGRPSPTVEERYERAGYTGRGRSSLGEYMQHRPYWGTL
jgi:hypothetical protein